MKCTMKPVKDELKNDHLIIVEFKMKLAMIQRDNETIEDLRFKPAAMVKNFEPKIQRCLRENALTR